MDVFELALECITENKCRFCKNNKCHKKTVKKTNLDLSLCLIDCAHHIRNWMDINYGKRKAIMEGVKVKSNKEYYKNLNILL